MKIVALLVDNGKAHLSLIAEDHPYLIRLYHRCRIGSHENAIFDGSRGGRLSFVLEFCYPPHGHSQCGNPVAPKDGARVAEVLEPDRAVNLASS